MNFFRSLLNVLLSGLMVCCAGVHFTNSIPSHMRRKLLVRSIVGQLGFFGYTLGLKYLSISTFSILVYMHPFWTSFFAMCMLKEPFQKVDFGGIIVCFVGVVLISLDEPPSQETAWHTATGVFFTVVTAILMGYIGTLTR